MPSDDRSLDGWARIIKRSAAQSRPTRTCRTCGTAWNNAWGTDATFVCPECMAAAACRAIANMIEREEDS